VTYKFLYIHYIKERFTLEEFYNNEAFRPRFIESKLQRSQDSIRTRLTIL